MTTYKIVRIYANPGHVRALMNSGLTLEEAQAHCNDPETSSKTCSAPQNITHTNNHGPWFDSYYEE